VVRLAATYRGKGPDVVLSIDVAVALDGDAIVLKAEGCRAGVVSIPLTFLSDLLAQPIHQAPGRSWHGSPSIDSNLRDGLRIGPRVVWPSGDRLYNVIGVEVRPGVLDLKIESLGPAYRSQMRRSDQDDDPFGSS